MTSANRIAALARELWTELLARLSHTLHECSQPDATRRLKGLGVRGGTGTIMRHLAREYSQATRMAALAGVELRPQDVAQRTVELTLRDDLDHDFHDLAATYQQLLLALAPESGSQLHQWLRSRARVHSAQAQGLASATLHEPAGPNLGRARDPPALTAMQPAPGGLYSATEPKPVLNSRQKDNT